MEYKQITLTEWLDIKQKLKENISSAKDKLNGLKKDFVRIGYLLRQIDDNELYKQDGYKSIAEFAKKECDLSPSDVSRFIQINKKYSVDGNSEELRPEFLNFGQSKLAAMLTLPDSDLAMITPETSREDIRELNRFNKAVPEPESDSDIEQLIRDFYISQEIVRKAVAIKDNPKELRELIAPSGSRSFRKSIWFILFHENKINIKKYAGVAKEMSWEEFATITAKVLEKYKAEGEKNADRFEEERENNKRDAIGKGRNVEENGTGIRENGAETRENDTGTGEDTRKPEENAPKLHQSETKHETNNDIPEESSEKDMGYTEESTGEKEQEKEVIAPAQKSLKPALIPSEEAVLKEEKKPIIRWDKMKSMSIPEVAEILLMGYKSHHLTFNSITDVENWLSEEMEK